jgi:hypothetical protein
MTQPTGALPETSETPAPPVPAAFGCQNGDGNAYTVILTRPGDSSADFLCDTCNLAMWLAVLQQMAASGMIDLGVPPPGQ